MSTITITKKVIEDQNVSISEVMVRKEVNYGTQRIISYIENELQNSIENNLLERGKKRKSFWLHGGGLKELLTMNLMEKHKTNMNKTSENTTYLIDNKTFLCQTINLHLLTARRGK